MEGMNTFSSCHSGTGQAYEEALAAVRQDGWMLKYVKEQTPEMCLVAVQQSRLALKCVEPQFKYLFE